MHMSAITKMRHAIYYGHVRNWEFNKSGYTVLCLVRFEEESFFVHHASFSPVALSVDHLHTIKVHRMRKVMHMLSHFRFV